MDKFHKLLDYAEENKLYDNFDDLELEWNDIVKKLDKWKAKVEKNYNELKEKGVI